MARGRIERWERGTGRLRDSQTGQEFFVGDRDLRGISAVDVQVGLEVEYDVGQDNQGRPRARNVRRVGAGAPAPVGRPRPPALRPPAARGPAIPEPPREIPLPASTRQLFAAVEGRDRHPGLVLDRFLVPCPQQEQQRDALRAVVATPGSADLLADLRHRWLDRLGKLGAKPWSRTTASPLTLHLARASALENAGICLHPIYGFAYLPGTGLKGLARLRGANVAALPEQRGAGVGRHRGRLRVGARFGYARPRYG